MNTEPIPGPTITVPICVKCLRRTEQLLGGCLAVLTPGWPGPGVCFICETIWENPESYGSQYVIVRCHAHHPDSAPSNTEPADA